MITDRLETLVGGCAVRDASRRCVGLRRSRRGCATHARGSVPPGTDRARPVPVRRGNEALNDKKWLTAREFFKQVTETYTQSPYRPDAKLGIGDTYLGEGTAEALVLAIDEFQEFLSFYPTNRARRLRAVQAGHGALPADARAAARSDRNARSDPRVRGVRRPLPEQQPDAGGAGQAARGAGSAERSRTTSSGCFYFRQRWYPGAIDRFRTLLKEDPEYTGRDAVYFYLAESLVKIEARSRSAALLRKAGRRNSSRASISPLAQKRITELKTTAHARLKSSGG